MSEAIVTRRQLLATAVIVPFPGLCHRRAGNEVFTLPTHAWCVVTSTALTARRVSVTGQDVSAELAAVIASLISDCPGELSDYRDLYFGMFEPTPEMEVGRLWFANPQRLERLSAFLRRGAFSIEEDDGWTVLTRSK